MHELLLIGMRNASVQLHANGRNALVGLVGYNSHSMRGSFIKSLVSHGEVLRIGSNLSPVQVTMQLKVKLPGFALI